MVSAPRGFRYPQPRYPLRGKLTARRGIAKVKRVAKLEFVIDRDEGRPHLPIVEIKRAA